MKSFILLAIAVMIASIESASIKNCGSAADIDFTKLEITGCSKGRRECIFKKNKTADIKIPLTPKNELTSLKASVHGIVFGVPIPFPVPNSEGCKSSLTCPVAAGELVTYTAGLPVLSSYPSIKVTVKWEMFDQNKKKQVCLLIPVQITD